MSVDYYTRLERGNLAGASGSALESVARALQPDEAEHAHLFDLARAATKSGSAGTPKRRRSSPASVRPSIQRLLDAMTGAPALVRNERLDYLAANALGRACTRPCSSPRAGPPNSARFVFLAPASRDFFVNWGRAADDLVAILRGEAGRHPYDKALTGRETAPPRRRSPRPVV